MTSMARSSSDSSLDRRSRRSFRSRSPSIEEEIEPKSLEIYGKFAPARSKDRPIIFKIEQRFRVLRSPEIRQVLRAALLARASGMGTIVYTAEGDCRLEPPEGDQWPATDSAHPRSPHSQRGEAEGAEEEFAVFRALGGPSLQLVSHLCERLLDLDLSVLLLASHDPTAMYLVCFADTRIQIAEALVQEHHGVRPVNEVYGSPSPAVLAAAGLSGLGSLHTSKCFRLQDLDKFAGAWVEEELNVEPAEPEGEEAESSQLVLALKQARRLRFVSRRGLFAEVHFSDPYRVAVGRLSEESSHGDMQASEDKPTATRMFAVDTEPCRPQAHHTSQVLGNEMHDSPEGVAWRRISEQEAPIAAAELLMEQAAGPGSVPPSCGLRAGAWIVCQDVALQVLGPPRGEGSIGGTLCQSQDQLQLLDNPEKIKEELASRFEASAGTASEGCIRRLRGVGWALKAKGQLLCGAQKEDGFKTASILYSTGLMTKGGSLTLESATRSFTQVWRIRELQDNPFDSPSLRAARKALPIPLAGRSLSGPSAQVARVASMMPKGKGKGKNKSKGRRPPMAAPRQAVRPFNRSSIGAWSGVRPALTVYGGVPSAALGPRPPMNRPRLGGFIQKVDSADVRQRGPRPDRFPPRNITLTSAPRRDRDHSVPRRKVRSRSPGRRGHARTESGAKHEDKGRHRSNRSRSTKRSRSRSRRRGRKPPA
ncbi:unnamed protein product [Effrenium voratum]|uniref:Uncharacterized protein n=1 Tax=Effrenium voratum TaxID=2562239 RepID=A0AA36I3M6_9DINO|nr:unnamed protein product [Effrenium voratum]